MCTWSKALNCSQVLRNRSLRPLLTPIGNLSPYPKIICRCCCKFTHFRHHLTTSHEEVEVPALSMPSHVPVPVPCPPCSPGVCTWGCYGADVGCLGARCDHFSHSKWLCSLPQLTVCCRRLSADCFLWRQSGTGSPSLPRPGDLAPAGSSRPVPHLFSLLVPFGRSDVLGRKVACPPGLWLDIEV